jgi:hypothetical protein
LSRQLVGDFCDQVSINLHSGVLNESAMIKSGATGMLFEVEKCFDESEAFT